MKRSLLILIALLTCLSKALLAQKVPPKEYALKYWYDPYDYPLHGIALDKHKKLRKKLEKTHWLPVTDNPYVKFNPQWGYDSIRCLEKAFEISPFYISKTEVTNGEFQKFLADSNGAFFKSNRITLSWASPDTSVWRKVHQNLRVMGKYYFAHEAYRDYPVVGVSQFQATQYCNWLQEKLNQKYAEWVPEGYYLEVDLPTQAEYVKSVQEFCIQTSPKLKTVKDPVNRYVLTHLYDINLGSVETARLAALVFQPEGAFHLTMAEYSTNQLTAQHLLGNVSEWTSSMAMGRIYNNQEYLFTMSKNLIPNPDITPSEEMLSGYLHKKEDLRQHFMVKGGSWLDEFHYLDPSAVQLRRGDFKSAAIGFRTVIRVRKKP